MINNPFRKHQKKMEKLNKESGMLETALERAEPDTKRYQKINQELAELTNSIDKYIENTYAFAVFEYYLKSQPALVVGSTGDLVSWNDIFGNSFEHLTKNQRHALVGLAEGYGQYRIKCERWSFEK